MPTTQPKEKEMRHPLQQTTRNVVETAIDASKRDKVSSWESIARQINNEADKQDHQTATNDSRK